MLRLFTACQEIAEGISVFRFKFTFCSEQIVPPDDSRLAKGCAVIKKSSLFPEQLTPLFENDGTTETFAINGEFVEFETTNEGIFPEPVAPNPIVDSVFTHEKIVFTV